MTLAAAERESAGELDAAVADDPLVPLISLRDNAQWHRHSVVLPGGVTTEVS